MPARSTAGLGRAALFAFRTGTAAAMVGIAACGGTSEPPREETIAQPYGAPPDPPPPPPDPTMMEEPATAEEPTMDDPGSGADLYGAPPPED